MKDIRYKMVQVRKPVHDRLIKRKRDREKAEEREVALSEIIRDGLDALDALDRAGAWRYGA